MADPQQAALDTADSIPVAEAAVQTPVAEAAVQTPVAEAAVQTPVAEAAVQTPVAEAAVQTPVAEAAVQKAALVSRSQVRWVSGLFWTAAALLLLGLAAAGFSRC